MSFRNLTFFAIVIVISGSGFLLYQKYKQTIADTIPETLTIQIVDEILKLPVENETQNVEIILNHLDTAEIPAFLTQSFWSLHSHLRLREWKSLFLKQSETFHQIPQKLKNKLISRYCVLERLNNEHSKCQILLHQFPPGNTNGNFEIFQSLIHSLKPSAANKIFQLYFLDKNTGCSRREFRASTNLAANWFYQISGNFKAANRCLKLMRKSSNDPWIEPYYIVESIRNELLQGKLSHQNKKLFLELNYNKLMPYEKLMYDLTSSYILYHEGKLKRALESFESIQLRLKNRKMLVFDNELTYFIKNFEKKKAQLPQPNHYYEWLAYTTIKNGP